jgi:uncharacterized protein YndB with AHSA1/START domain
MRLFSHTIIIDRPREAVFDFFTDWSQSPRWRAYVKSMTPLEPGPVRAGSRLNVEMDLMGDPYSFEMTVLECDRPSRWRHRTDEADFTGYIEYTFDAEGAGTRVTMTGHAKPVTLYGWAATPLLLLSRNKSYRDQLPALKRALEAK